MRGTAKAAVERAFLLERLQERDGVDNYLEQDSERRKQEDKILLATKELDLSNCSLYDNSFASRAFHTLESLTSLYLANNFLVNLTFSIPTLERLDLSNNRIKSLDFLRGFPGLLELFIAGNPVLEDRAYICKSVDLCPELIRLDRDSRIDEIKMELYRLRKNMLGLIHPLFKAAMKQQTRVLTKRDLKQEIAKGVIQKVEENSGAPLGAARRAYVEWKTFKEVGELRGIDKAMAAIKAPTKSTKEAVYGSSVQDNDYNIHLRPRCCPCYCGCGVHAGVALREKIEHLDLTIPNLMDYYQSVYCRKAKSDETRKPLGLGHTSAQRRQQERIQVKLVELDKKVHEGTLREGLSALAQTPNNSSNNKPMVVEVVGLTELGGFSEQLREAGWGSAEVRRVAVPPVRRGKQPVHGVPVAWEEDTPTSAQHTPPPTTTTPHTNKRLSLQQPQQPHHNAHNSRHRKRQSERSESQTQEMIRWPKGGGGRRVREGASPTPSQKTLHLPDVVHSGDEEDEGERVILSWLPVPSHQPTMVQQTLELPQSNHHHQFQEESFQTPLPRKKAFTLFGNVFGPPPSASPLRRPHHTSPRGTKSTTTPTTPTTQPSGSEPMPSIPIKSKRAVAYVDEEEKEERDGEGGGGKGESGCRKRKQLPPLQDRQVQMRAERVVAGETRERVLYEAFEAFKDLPCVDMDRGVCILIGKPVLKYLEERKQLIRWYPLGILEDEYVDDVDQTSSATLTKEVKLQHLPSSGLILLMALAKKNKRERYT